MLPFPQVLEVTTLQISHNNLKNIHYQEKAFLKRQLYNKRRQLATICCMMEKGRLLIKGESKQLDSSDSDGQENYHFDTAGKEMLVEKDLKPRGQMIKTEEEHEGILENDSWLKKWTEPEEDVKSLKITRTTLNFHNKSVSESTKLNLSDGACNLGKHRIKNQVTNKKLKVVKKKASQYLNSSAISQVIKNAQMSEILSFGKCIFKCLYCPIQLESWQPFSIHLRRAHKKKALMTEIAKYIVKATAHECKICLEKVLCDLSFCLPISKSTILTLGNTNRNIPVHTNLYETVMNI